MKDDKISQRPTSARSSISTLSTISSTVSSAHENYSHFRTLNDNVAVLPLKQEQQLMFTSIKEETEQNYNQLQTSERSQHVTGSRRLALYLPTSSNLAASFEEMERSLRNLQSKLDNLAMREMEDDGEDSNALTIISKVIQIIPQNKQNTEAMVLTETSSKKLLSDIEKKNNVVSSTIERKGKEVQTTTSFYKSNVKINDGKKKKKPFIAGSRIPQRPKSFDRNLISIIPLQKEIKHEASCSSTYVSKYHDARSPVAEIFSQRRSSSNVSTPFTSFFSNHVDDEKESDTHKLSFTISSTNFEPTLHLPLDLYANIPHGDAERLNHSTLSIVQRDVGRDESDDDNQIRQQLKKLSNSPLVNSETLSISSSKKLRLHPQPEVIYTSNVDSFITSSSSRANSQMSSIKALVSLQQSRRLVFEALGQLEEIKENCSNEGIFANSLEIPSSNNSSTIMRIPTYDFCPTTPLSSPPSNLFLPSSSFQSQYSLDLKRSIAASLSLLPSRDEILRVEGHLKPERFYGDLLDEIHKKGTLFATTQNVKERIESTFVKGSNYCRDHTETSQSYQETDRQDAESANIIKHLPIHQLPVTPTHMMINNTRNESLLSRSTTIIQHDIHQETQFLADNQCTLNNQRIKRELEKWLSQSPV